LRRLLGCPAVILVAGCAQFITPKAPPPDPAGGALLPLTAYVEVAQRPPEQPPFGRRILEWALLADPETPVIHLGDLLDMSCESEMDRMSKVFATAWQPKAIRPGNHDGFFLGSSTTSSCKGSSRASRRNGSARAGAVRASARHPQGAALRGARRLLPPCQQSLHESGMRYQDALLETISELYQDFQNEVPEVAALLAPSWCGGRSLTVRIARLRAAQAADLDGTIRLFRARAQFRDKMNAKLDALQDTRRGTPLEPTRNTVERAHGAARTRRNFPSLPAASSRPQGGQV
jgi:hypothetical protein